MVKVSVIVPVYNGEKYLTNLINCFLNQDYKDFEVIFVDDGSTDNSKEILLQYSEENPTFRYYFQENAGAAAARNNGLLKAGGDYITFVDCDDEITSDYISVLAQKCNNGADICFGSYLIKERNGRIINKRIIEQKPLGLLANIATCGKMYRKNIIETNNICFLTGSALFEDAYFTFGALNVAGKIDVVKKPIYHQIVNGDSITHTKGKDFSVIKETVKTFEKIKTDIKFKDSELLDYFFIKSAIYCILFGIKNQRKEDIYSTYDEVYGWIKENTARKNKYLSLFRDFGETFSVKFIIDIFRLMQKLGLVKIILVILSKI